MTTRPKLRCSVSTSLFEDEREALRKRAKDMDLSLAAYVAWLLLRDISNDHPDMIVRIRERSHDR